MNRKVKTFFSDGAFSVVAALAFIVFASVLLRVRLKKHALGEENQTI